jgi:hypothetical protein
MPARLDCRGGGPVQGRLSRLKRDETRSRRIRIRLTDDSGKTLVRFSRRSMTSLMTA